MAYIYCLCFALIMTLLMYRSILPSFFLKMFIFKLLKNNKMFDFSIDVNDTRWSYIRGGEGQTMVLVHGFGSHKFQWGNEMYSFSKNYDLICIDLPGSGNSKLLNNFVVNPKAQAERLINFLDCLNVNNTILIGASVGGYVASYVSLLRPDLVEKLVLLDSAGFIADKTQPAMQHFIETGLHPFSYSTSQQMDYLYSLLFVEQPKLPSFLKSFLIRKNKKEVVIRDESLRQLRKFGLFNLTEQLPFFRDNTLLIWGEKDQLFDLSTLNQFSNPKFVKVVIDGAGHLPYLEKPHQTFNAIDKFLSSSIQKALVS
ncbi:alpha/beta hydrolase [Acinetobacter baumannii]